MFKLMSENIGYNLFFHRKTYLHGSFTYVSVRFYAIEKESTLQYNIHTEELLSAQRLGDKNVKSGDTVFNRYLITH